MPCPTDVNISRREADRFGSTPYSSLISLAIGPAITIATVLFAVHISTSSESRAIPACAPLCPRIRLLIWFRINVIPPFFLTSHTIHATMIEMTVISYMDTTPSPTTLNISDRRIFPDATPTMSERTVPLMSTMNTLIPISAPTRTTI